MAMDGQRNGHGRHLTYHPNRYNSPIDMKRTQSDTRQVLNSHTVATAARIHRSPYATLRELNEGFHVEKRRPAPLTS